MTDTVEVTQADRERKKRIQHRFLTSGVSHSQVLDEELARHRHEAAEDYRNRAERAEAECQELRAKLDVIAATLRHRRAGV